MGSKATEVPLSRNDNLSMLRFLRRVFCGHGSSGSANVQFIEAVALSQLHGLCFVT